MTIKLQRRYPKASTAKALRFWLLILFAMFSLLLLAFALKKAMGKPEKIQIKMLNKEQFLLQKDTITYQELAGKVLEKLKNKDKKQTSLELYLPNTLNTAEVLPLIQLLQATNYPLELRKLDE